MAGGLGRVVDASAGIRMRGMTISTCIRCHGSNLHPGAMQTMGALHFLPDSPTLRSRMGFGGVRIQSRVCLDCGTVELTADPDEVAAAIETP